MQPTARKENNLTSDLKNNRLPVFLHDALRLTIGNSMDFPGSNDVEPRARPSLEDVLSIYTYNNLPGVDNFLGTNKQFVLDSENIEKILNTVIILPQKRFIDLIPDKKYSIENVKKHLFFRHPIHIKTPRYDSIDEKKLENVLGYGRNEASVVDGWTDSSMRYAILGWTPIFQDQFAVAEEAYILHLWGINLESADTTDYKYIFNTNEKFGYNRKRYLELLAMMFGLIGDGAKKVNELTKKDVVLRITYIGLGNWANMIPKEKEKEILKIHYKNNLRILAENFAWLTIYHADYSPEKNKSKTIIYKGLNQVEAESAADKAADPFGPPHSIPEDKSLLVINAWDDRSFIGNGGSVDNSLDGWITSQSPNFWPNYANLPLGSNFINASYMHNAFFNPKIYDQI